MTFIGSYSVVVRAAPAIPATDQRDIHPTRENSPPDAEFCDRGRAVPERIRWESVDRGQFALARRIIDCAGPVRVLVRLPSYRARSDMPPTPSPHSVPDKSALRGSRGSCCRKAWQYRLCRRSQPVRAAAMPMVMAPATPMRRDLIAILASHSTSSGQPDASSIPRPASGSN